MESSSLNGMYSSLIVPQGTNLRSERWLTAPLLSSALTETAAFLRRVGGSDPTLLRYDDWWEHDGLHLPRQDERIDFDVLLSLVETPESLEAAMPDDFNVFVGIAPPNFEWYLRFYLEIDRNMSASKTGGRFDLTLPEDLVDAYRQ